MHYCTCLCFCLITGLICLFVRYSCESVAVMLDLAVSLPGTHLSCLVCSLFIWSLLGNNFEQLSDYKIKMPNLFPMCSNEFFSGDSGYLLRKKNFVSLVLCSKKVRILYSFSYSLLQSLLCLDKFSRTRVITLQPPLCGLSFFGISYEKKKQLYEQNYL